MFFLIKLRETALAVIPVILLVVLLSVTIAPLPAGLLGVFLIDSLLLILGLTLFLTGAEIGIMPAGSYLGGALTRSRKLPLILVSGFIIGFIITVAEPALLILGDQVQFITGTLQAIHLVTAVAIGTGFFVTLALARTVFQIPLKLLLLGGYLVVFALASRTAPLFVAIAFDSGGATTGPMTVPFIIALGLGIAGVRGDKKAEDDSFGLIGIASIGPILAVSFLGLFLDRELAGVSAQTAAETVRLSAIVLNVAKALAPLAALIIIYQLFLMKLPPRQIQRLSIGFIYAFAGLVIFFYSAEHSFIAVGKSVGQAIGSSSLKALLVPLGFAVGAIVTCAEPAIWLLAEQVEEVSAGNIRRPVMLFSLALGVGLAVALAMLRVVFPFSIWYLLIPFYTAALLLMSVTPDLFTAIAFDSGGVASGPLSGTFILALTLGASSGSGGNPAMDAFGLIAMIAVSPIVCIQLLGWLFTRSEQKIARRKAKAGSTRTKKEVTP